MTAASVVAQHQAALAFDNLAEHYDDLFTRSLIGRAQRDAVWKRAGEAFSAGDHVLELNCGTGEDALFLSRLGVAVTACDASERMILQAERRRELEAPQSAIAFKVLPTENLAELQVPFMFDGVFSNFSGLNCVADLAAVAKQLSTCVRPGAPLLLCLSTRVCLWEILWFLSRGEFRKAFRRCGGQAAVSFGEFTLTVQYPTVHRLRGLFSPAFVLRSWTGIGVAVPPSYLEPWARKHPKSLNALRRLDRIICNWPGFRIIGDHVLLCFEPVQP
ncbi:MAG: class I SAM-dependent methyltransferase [Acidobacteriaceae bacterium]